VSLEPLVDRRPPVLRQAGSLQGTDLVGKGPAAPVEMRTSAAEYLGQALKTEFTRQGHKWVAEAAKAEVALSGALLHYWVEANVKPFVVTWRAHVELELSARPVGVEPPPRPKAYVGSATGSYAPEMTPDPEARAFARRLLDEALDQLLTRLANDSEITQAFSFAPGRN
jgi:hypothetical protein